MGIFYKQINGMSTQYKQGTNDIIRRIVYYSNMDKFKKLLEEKRVVIADGAWGTRLLELGLKDECPEVWNITHPEEIKKLARSYVDAKSEIILTNTFGGSFLKLKKYKAVVFCFFCHF